MEHGVDIGAVFLAFAAALIGPRSSENSPSGSAVEPAVLGELAVGALISALGARLGAALGRRARARRDRRRARCSSRRSWRRTSRSSAASARRPSRSRSPGRRCPFAGGLRDRPGGGPPDVDGDLHRGRADRDLHRNHAARAPSESSMCPGHLGGLYYSRRCCRGRCGRPRDPGGRLEVRRRRPRLEAATIVKAPLALALGAPRGGPGPGHPARRQPDRLVEPAGSAGSSAATSVAFALLVAWSATAPGQSAPIVGAFAPGAALARTNRRHDIDHAAQARRRHLRPGLFVYVGAEVDVRLDRTRAENRPALLLGPCSTIVGFLGSSPPDSARGRPCGAPFIGAGIVPRGEVGLDLRLGWPRTQASPNWPSCPCSSPRSSRPSPPRPS